MNGVADPNYADCRTPADERYLFIAHRLLP